MKRKVLSLLVVAVLCVGVVAGATMAYLSDREQAENSFVFSSSGVDGDQAINISLAEPNWQWDSVFTGETPRSESDKPPLYGGASDKVYSDWGVKKAVNFRPGSIIPKDPQIKNIGKEDAYVGFIITAQDKSGLSKISTLKRIEEVFTINWDKSGDWELLHTDGDGTKYFAYSKALKPGEIAPPIFNKITVKNDNGENLKGSDRFEIVVKAFAVQAGNDAWGTDPDDPDQGRLNGDWTPANALRAEFGKNSSNDFKDFDW